MDLRDFASTPEFEEWLNKHGVPPPHMGGSFAYCPHQTAEVVKEPRKKARTVYKQCKFKTRGIRRYARHYRRHHGSKEA